MVGPGRAARSLPRGGDGRRGAAGTALRSGSAGMTLRERPCRRIGLAERLRGSGRFSGGTFSLGGVVSGGGFERLCPHPRRAVSPAATVTDGAGPLCNRGLSAKIPGRPLSAAADETKKTNDDNTGTENEQRTGDGPSRRTRTRRAGGRDPRRSGSAAGRRIPRRTGVSGRDGRHRVRAPLHAAPAPALVAHLRGSGQAGGDRRVVRGAGDRRGDLRRRALAVADPQHREGAAVPRPRPHAPDSRHLPFARADGLRQDAGAAGQLRIPAAASVGHVDPPRAAAGRHGHARRRGRTRDRDRPPHRAQPHRQAEGGSEAYRPPDGRAALEPRTDGARGAGGLYERRQVDAHEPHLQERGLRREQALRHARHHGAQGGLRQPPLPASSASCPPSSSSRSSRRSTRCARPIC